MLNSQVSGKKDRLLACQLKKSADSRSWFPLSIEPLEYKKILLIEKVMIIQS